MKANFKFLMSFALMVLVTTTLWAQSTFTGKVVDAETGETIPGASVLQQGTTNGTSTDIDGNFSLQLSGKGRLVITFVGYADKVITFDAARSTSLGTIVLSQDALGLDEVVVIGVADIAKDRETPVAVSTIKAEEIMEKLGTKEFPEILKTTPSVYATKQGGGFGDSRVNIRGFDQRNTAVMVNGMPVNDMENGWVYWSNWAGLSDVTSAMQVQRGLGSSKLAISSVGGTINVLTRAAQKNKGGSISVRAGNDNYLKTLGSYNSGMMDNGFSVSALIGRTSGDGFVDGTKFEGYNYFLALGFKPNENHDLQFTVTGAPQWHHQRSYAPSLGDYLEYGEDGDPNIKYNSDWGYLNGEEYSFRRNFYHKPIASLNWDWNLSEKSKIATVLYASVGRGGGTGEIGHLNGTRQYALPKTSRGLVPVDVIQQWNMGQQVPSAFANPKYNQPRVRSLYDGGRYNTGNNGHPNGGGKYGSDNGISRRASMNSHNWYGVISNFNTELSETLTLDFGIDLRSYKGIHYRRVEDLLGADAYIDYDNVNYPNGRKITETYPADFSSMMNVFESVDDEQKIDYHNDGKVRWYGGFGQLEYKKDAISMFIQGAVSSQGYKRIDYFNYLDSDPEQESDWESLVGGNVKGGMNWNINDNHNLFFNAGFYSRQPNFDAVFPNYNDNYINDDLINEKVIGLELGYGFRSENARFNVNLYRTSWADRYTRFSSTFDVNNTPDNNRDDVRGIANLEGVEQIHMGVEFDGNVRLSDNFSLNAMVSYGNWEYGSDVTAAYYDEANNPIQVNGQNQEETLYLDGVKVGDAAQFTARLGFDLKLPKGFKLDMNYLYADKLYADIDHESFNYKGHKGSLELPSYGLLEGGISFKEEFGNNNSITIRFNMDNILDETYISESETNIFPEAGDRTWDGISTKNRVFFGWGRTWNVSATYRF
ncbi:TonB-dependent receptor-like protein [Balneicella halophila]|uniref:TonB-dependent receptor-like protein n=1 Tax=Balneicella halophila TaxID=1537566 RepID=A0A7L4US83_BALHA|nr:carboxypeptidase-like regulatory domain-containing protein [Balneicella halophila]PVX52067.1 TonB-dependent receptor-like protein [Balneicella halophila]